ncbi:uncharacterized protein [Diadema setosum]|uniref:uncharacterized protein isoform X2 n=1 Tax=Diadema setosum TaxID=31175 RepID=UPI003B3BD599
MTDTMMAGLKNDPNKGPLKLEHDITPRDLHHINTIGLSNSFNLDDSYRFKGFPDSNFTSGRHPLLGSPKPVETSGFYRRPQHFVKGLPYDYKSQTKQDIIEAEITTENGVHPGTWRPNVIAKTGVQYGSEEHDRVTSTVPVSPKKKKTPFWNEDRTSAEERKKARQQRDADWDRAQYMQQKEQQSKATYEEKKRDLKMLRDYKPFGRPGGGAPRREQEAYRTKAVTTKELDNQGPEMLMFPQFGKPGHGAPIRTDSGKVKTSIRANNDIRFRDGLGLRKQVENTVRYTNSKDFGDKVNEELGNMALEKKTQKEMERYLEKEEERKTWEFNPFGKSGAGAPIKTDSGNLVTGRVRTLVKDPAEMKQIEEKPHMKKLAPETGGDYDPWGKGQGAPVRDPEGNTKRLRWSDPNTAPEFYVNMSTGVALETKPVGGGGHLIDERGERKTRLQQTLQHDSNPGEHIKIDESTRDPNEPWGRPGGGAPIYRPDGKVQVLVSGKATKDKMGVDPPKAEEVEAKRKYLSTLKSNMEEQKMQREFEAREVKKPGGETVNWMRSKEVGYRARDPATGTVLPIHHKAYSDVTKHMMDVRRPGIEARDYRTDLVQQAEQRAQQRDAEKIVSRQAVNQHYDTFDQRWGKPGHGAPYEPAMKRHSLDLNKLHQMEGTPRHAGQPNARTKALESRFRDPTQQPAVPRQQPTVGAVPAVVNGQYQLRAPWAAYTL